MLRLAFDFIITWRETRTRPNAYLKRMVITHDIHNIHAFFLIPAALFLYLAGRQR